MELQQYIEFVRSAIHPNVKPDDLPLYAELGWQGELGEIWQLLSKALRQVDRHSPLPDEHWEKLVDECGDVLFYQVVYCLSKQKHFGAASIWGDLRVWTLVVKRLHSIEYLAEDVFSFEPISVKIDPIYYLPEGLTLKQLAERNHAKLMQRKAETGAYAKTI